MNIQKLNEKNTINNNKNNVLIDNLKPEDPIINIIHNVIPEYLRMDISPSIKFYLSGTKHHLRT